MVNCSLFQSFWALRTVAATHLPSPATWQAAVRVFLEQLVHSLQKPGWVKRTLSSKYWDLFWLSVARLLQAPLPPAEVTSGRFKGPVPSFSPFIFHFSPFVSQALKMRSFKSNCIYGEKFNVTVHIQGKAQNRHRKTLSLHLGLILVQIAYNNHTHKNF